MSVKKELVNAVQVQSTNDASIVSKCSMANSNYVRDDYVKHFVEKQKKRAPLIHLGYYTRSVIFSELLVKFIKYLHINKILKFQIISCGSGFDTSYWRLSEDGLLSNSLFIEIDYPNVINRKLALINQSEKLRSVLHLKIDESSNVKKLNPNYFLLCADLCDIKMVESLLKDVNIDFDVPTLFLSECVITYMKEADSNRLIEWMSKKFKNSAFVNYEQIHPEDGFGEVMLRHFDKLQSSLNSVRTYPDCLSHKERYKLLGFEKSAVASEWDFLELLTTVDERKRVLMLEQFDEFEEFHMKCTHYVVAVAANNALSAWPDQINIMELYQYCEKAEFSLESAGEGF
ncbi:UNVERIFIED_CONTAM: hypothetical protein PYX00_010112 [Menopon gallinae]|uniref:Leucine carboxyl methyltransferase 1 n=1 Tax=Menopon gallinae TaxID=328185 RepID=A0AAW2HET9_9NEOP